MSDYKLKISEMAEEEKPVEKLLSKGAAYLSDAELLAILLKNGIKGQNVVELAQTVLNSHPLYKGLVGLHYMTAPELNLIEGIGPMKAASILALSELSKRMMKVQRTERVRFSNPYEIADYFMNDLRFMEKECVIAAFLDGSSRLLKSIKLTEGTVKRSLVPVRELFIEALRYSAVYLVLIHNHPSGDPEPSEADIQITKRICEAGKMLEIGLLDHIIIGDKRFCSLAERGIIT